MKTNDKSGSRRNNIKTKKVDARILRTVKQREQFILRSISWISISVAFFYVAGYAWNHCYYNVLGIPPNIVDFNFPEILVPKWPLIIFLAQVFLTFLYFQYRNFYKKQRRSQRARKMGLKKPLDDILNYSLKQNISASGKVKKTNHWVFCDFTSQYCNDKSQENADWKFERKEFEIEVLKLFPDIPDLIKEEFVSYELQILFMNDDELYETVADAAGAFPEGSEVYRKVSLYGFYIILIIYGVSVVLYSVYVLWNLVFMAAGMGVGYCLYKTSEYEDRFELWHTLLASILLAICLSGADGHITAKLNLKRILLPIATITQTDGIEQKGLLLAHFSDKYVLAPFVDVNEPYKIVSIHTHAISSIELTNIRWLQKYTKELEKTIRNIPKEIESIKAQKRELLGENNTNRQGGKISEDKQKETQ